MLSGVSENFAEQIAVCKYWQMMAVLLIGRNGDEDGKISREFFHLRPRQVL